MQLRTVILGGVGFIGTHLCLRLLAEGHEVFCVDLRDAASSPLLRGAQRHPSFRYVHHNIINSFGIRCDRIYNLAAPTMVHYNHALPVETLKACMLGSINALDTARAERARVLYASGSDSYGLRDPNTTNHDCCSTHHVLAEGKRAAEVLHRTYQTEFGVDTRIARIFNTYGSGAEIMDQRVVMKMVVAALQNRDILINGTGEQRRTFCWVEDIVDGLVRFMESEPTQATRTLDFGSGAETSIRSLAEKIIALSGSRSRILHTEARSDDVRRRAPDLAATRRELGWAPSTSLTVGLQRTISYAEKELADKAYAAMTWAETNL